MALIKVVCGIIYKDKNILLCRRKPNKSLGGYWEFPGGKVEKGESLESSLKRELLEELDLNVEIESYFDKSIYCYGDTTIELIAYLCKTKNSPEVLHDHDSFEWVIPNKILEWNLAPADIPLARKIVDEGNKVIR